MQLIRESNKKLISFEESQKIGSGGEGAIYLVPGDKRLVAKVYHKSGPEQESKLKAMLAAPPEDPMRDQGHAAIAWPIDLLRREPASTGEQGAVAGFLMPRLAGMCPVIDLFVPRTRLESHPLFNYQYLHRAGRNLSAALAALHGAGCVVGDINESNILVSEAALVSLVDTDSFQVRDRKTRILYRCAVGKAEFTPPELQRKSLKEVERTVLHDHFGLAVVIFQLLMEGTHPFAGLYKGQGEPPGMVERIEKGSFTFGANPGRFAPPPIAPDFGIIDPEIRDLMLCCFDQGHRSPAKRPSADVWHEALGRAEERLKSCRHNTQHRFGRHLTECPWCLRAEALGGRDYFPSLKLVKSGARLTQNIVKPVPKQAALPVLNAVTAPGSTTPSGYHAGNSVITAKVGGRYRQAWGDWAKGHPVAHTVLCAAACAAAFGGLRYGIALAAPGASDWLVWPGRALNSGAQIRLALVAAAVGAGAVAAVRMAALGSRP